jgi:hypothetical protein
MHLGCSDFHPVSVVTGVELVTLSGPKQSSDKWAILRRWDVPWEWQTVVLSMVGCGVR